MEAAESGDGDADQAARCYVGPVVEEIHEEATSPKGEPLIVIADAGATASASVCKPTVEEPSDSEEEGPTNGPVVVEIGIRQGPVIEEPSASEDEETTRTVPLKRALTQSLSQFDADYQLLEKIGHGSSGSVHRALAKDATSQVVAVKIIDVRKWYLAGMEPDRICQEIEVMRRVDNLHLVKLHRVYKGDSFWYIVMDFVSGKELYDVILREEQLREEEMRPVFCQLTEALTYLHNIGIIHRDIKPENIIIPDERGPSGEMQARLLDFGLAKVLTSFAVAGRTIVGTDGYVAPEIVSMKCLRREGNSGEFERISYGFPVDMYSLGATLYVALTGSPCRPEFTDGEAAGTKQVTFPKEKVQHLSAEVQDLLAGLMTYDPKARLSAAATLRHPWLRSKAPLGDAARLSLEDSPIDARTSVREIDAQMASAAKIAKSGSAELDVGVSRQRISGSIPEADAAIGLQVTSLGLVQKRIAQVVRYAREHGHSSEAVRHSTLICRDQLHWSAQLLRNAAGTAVNVLEVLEDVQLALQEGEVKVAHEFFTSIAEWTGKLRKETVAVQQDLRKGIGDVWEVAARTGALLPQSESRSQQASSNDSRQPSGIGQQDSSDQLVANEGSTVSSAVSQILDHLEQIDAILESICAFWCDAESLFGSQLQRGEHLQRFLKSAIESSQLRVRVQERLEQFSLFWTQVRSSSQAFQCVMDGLRQPYLIEDFCEGVPSKVGTDASSF
eukprot:TRINITY_DN95091_c0_g1_i1.p1 TRINITY_DN95091_c0_g1~~TRINITY_DN95091_c0_g1_i1.p1  ORF type:complete len:729 (+),score=155.29 TRINITY_DN95091_c0_g1_i1:29-2215(+)